MADPEHLALARRGAEAIGEWRATHPTEMLHLQRANLRRADLGGANLIGALLIGANLSRANLAGANLNAANLRGADLARANLIMANLSVANLTQADLSGANLGMANLSVANLSRADLTGSRMMGAVLFDAPLAGADLSRAHLGGTSFSRCDLSGCRGLETVEHLSPSSIGVDTLIRTLQGAGGRFTDEQSRFFESVGVPGLLLAYLPSLQDLYSLRFYSCLIAHTDVTGEDKEFADRLYDALKEHGVDCWMYERDALIGRPPWDQIHRAMHRDKVLVVCSRASLERPGVRKEMDDALKREDQLKALKASLEEEARGSGKPAPSLDTDVLFPVRIDGAILTWDDPRRQAIMDNHHVGDFTGWRDDEKFETSLQGLLRALDPKSWPPPEARGTQPSGVRRPS